MQEQMDWFQELVGIMARLRGEQGCPWDREQTHESLQRYLLEETAEFVDALAMNDKSAMCDELGDVLLQIVFHAQIASEAGDFNMDDVTRGICEKMIRRHPHVFGTATVDESGAVIRQWERIKAEERRERGQVEGGTLDGVPRSLPALHRAYKVQKKAARVGFDWPTVDGVVDKVREELEEVCQAMAAGNPEAIAEEIGDLLFSVTNLSRFLGHFPEDALHQTVRKFEDRFRLLEAELDKQQRRPTDCSLDELEQLWHQAKAREKKLPNRDPDFSEESGEVG